MDNARLIPASLPPNAQQRPSFSARLSASLTFKFALVAALLVALQIPLLLFHLLQSDRTSHQALAEAEVSNLWGGHQTLGAPVLKFGALVKRTREFVDNGKRTQEVVDAPYMVVMLVGDEDGAQRLGHLDAQHLLTEVGAAVHEEPRVALLEERRSTQAAVAGVATGAYFALATDLRHSDACACSKDSYCH